MQIAYNCTCGAHKFYLSNFVSIHIFKFYFIYTYMLMWHTYLSEIGAILECSEDLDKLYERE